MRTVLYPGSFDPVTNGHMDIIERAAALFDTVVVGVLHNAQKPSGAFPATERVQLLKAATAHLPGVHVNAYEGLLVDAVRECGADAVVRGLRSMGDADIELQMARLNRQLGQIETLMLAASPEVCHISASMVRDIGRHGGDLSGLVPMALCARIAEKLDQGE